MSQTDASNLLIENLLSAVTDVLLQGDDDLETIIAQYNVPRASVDPLVKLIRRLHYTLVGVTPSQRFVKRLKQDLIGTSGATMLSRVRYLPARVQIAAGVAVIAGFMLITRRRLIAEAGESQEAHALQ